MYEIALYTHFLGMAVALYFILRADHDAAWWFLGKKETLDADQVHYYHRGVWAGWALLLVSGIYLTWPMAEYYLTMSQVFQAKMLFVLALTLNGIMIGRIDHIASEKSFRVLTNRERFPLILSGAISATCWTGAFVAGILLFPGWALW